MKKLNKYLTESIFDIDDDNISTPIGELVENSVKLDSISGGVAKFVFNRTPDDFHITIKDLSKYVDLANQYGVNECNFSGSAVMDIELSEDCDLDGIRITATDGTLVILHSPGPHKLSNGTIEVQGKTPYRLNSEDFSSYYGTAPMIKIVSRADWGELNKMKLVARMIEFGVTNIPILKRCEFDTDLISYSMYYDHPTWSKVVLPYIKDPEDSKADKNLRQKLLIPRRLDQLKQFDKDVYIYRNPAKYSRFSRNDEFLEVSKIL